MIPLRRTVGVWAVLTVLPVPVVAIAALSAGLTRSPSVIGSWVLLAACIVWFAWPLVHAARIQAGAVVMGARWSRRRLPLCEIREVRFGKYENVGFRRGNGSALFMVTANGVVLLPESRGCGRRRLHRWARQIQGLARHVEVLADFGVMPSPDATLRRR